MLFRGSFSPLEADRAMLVLDAVFFQQGRTGIARLWQRTLAHWAGEAFAREFVVVDRGGTCPRLPGITYVDGPRYSLTKVDDDRAFLQEVCDHVGARWFLSTYYTTPLTTPAVFMCYDMIPEVLRFDLAQPIWREKARAIAAARAFIAISHTSALDLLWFHPHMERCPGLVAHCGTDFAPAPPAAVAEFRRDHGLDRPYILTSGMRGDYKNVLLLFRALAHLGSLRDQLAIVCGDAAMYVAPRNPAGLARELARLLGDESLRAALAARGAARAARFSWTTMAATIAAFLRSLPTLTAHP